jgi:4-amino-4-deoxy-L-arabinose transferase-like glycosyltransferase
MMRALQSNVLILALTVAVVALRLVGLGEYPALNPDEGFWAGGPRNLVLFGDGLMDGRLHPFLSPATFVLLSGWFEVAAPSLVTARLFSVLAGLLACVAIGFLSRRLFPARPWLFVLLFGLSSLAILFHRIGLLEAHQTFWLALAATLWLSRLRGAALWSGAAFGVALLVKSNSLYLLPAFLLTPPASTGEGEGTARPSWAAGALFLVACVLTAGGGYLAAWSLDPAGFATAFRYELDGHHFLDDGVLFHVGRFGLHPARSLTTAKELFLIDPLLLLLALAGLVLVARRPGESTRADRFFAAWVVVGLAFYFGQIYVEVRYLSTLAPAYLAARFLDRMLDRAESARLIRGLTLAVVLLFCGFHGARIVRGVALRPNADYWRTVAWVREHVPEGANVIAAPSIGLSLPRRSYDFYRLVYPYDGPPVPIAPIVERYGITFLIVDAEWHAYETPDMRRFLAENCSRRATIAGTDIFEVR